MHAIDGIHHITLITGDAPRNVDFYARVMWLRLVKKTVNQDDPSVYHLFYSDERGSPGADITFFEYPGAQPGRAGAGMIDRIAHRVGGEAALDFWSGRLADEGVEVIREPGRLLFADPEGMSHELVVDRTEDAALTARSNEVPEEFALRGFDSVHALVGDPAGSEALLRDALGFTESAENVWEARGERRGGRIAFAQSEERGVPGAGTVHHIAWAVLRAEQEQWRERVIAAGTHPTPIIDRFYFESVYFREPSGILYELATLDGAGFTADEAPETLGQRLALPPRFEPMREQIEPHLEQLPDTSRWRPAPVVD
jgi:glyoxalase family protein